MKNLFRGLRLQIEGLQLSPTMSLADALDQAAQRGLLYVIILSTQNEMHRSVTLTILHGRNPQGNTLCCLLRYIIMYKCTVTAVYMYVGLTVVYERHSNQAVNCGGLLRAGPCVLNLPSYHSVTSL